LYGETVRGEFFGGKCPGRFVEERFSGEEVIFPGKKCTREGIVLDKYPDPHAES